MKVDFGHYRTPLSSKQKNIKAFQRLIELSREHKYHGPRFDDKHVEGLCYCVYSWLNLSGYTCEIRGNTVLIQFEDGPFRIAVQGTHISHPNYPESTYAADDEYTLEVFNFFGFVRWFDRELRK
jgi:hypothetical protein